MVDVVSITPDGILLQLSVADTVTGGGIFEQFTVALAGTPDSTGPVTSVTVIVWFATVEVPHKFVAVHVLVIT